MSCLDDALDLIKQTFKERDEARADLASQQQENARVMEIVAKTPVEWRQGLPYAEQRILAEYVGQSVGEFLTPEEELAAVAFE